MGSRDLLHRGQRRAKLLNEMNHLSMERQSWGEVQGGTAAGLDRVRPSRGLGPRRQASCASAHEEIRIYNRLYKEYMFQSSSPPSEPRSREISRKWRRMKFCGFTGAPSRRAPARSRLAFPPSQLLVLQLS